MQRLPDEFEALLSRRGRRVLAGTDSACGALLDPAKPFAAFPDLLDARRCAEVRDVLEREMRETLQVMSDPIPPETITHMQFNYEEWLPKTVRVGTAYLDHPRARSYRAAERIGLVTMMRSESFAAFARALAGRALRKRHGIQLLCYSPGDYSGPHNDHHPEDAEAKDGYLDVHVSLTTPGVAHHFLVYAEGGHFSRMENVATVGGVTAYRLPFWHYTTPLVAKPGMEAGARRWLLLGTFLFDRRRGK